MVDRPQSNNKPDTSAERVHREAHITERSIVELEEALVTFSLHRSIHDTFEIPQCNVDSGKSRHENWTAAVETQSPDQLPDVLNVAAASTSKQCPSTWD